MKKQIRNLSGIVGLTVDSAADGKYHDSGIVITFDNNTFIIIESECNWNDGADAAVDVATPYTSQFLVDAGVFTQEEHDKRMAEDKRKREDTTRTWELEQLAKLKKKYQ